jgi:hypothetical protein
MKSFRFLDLRLLVLAGVLATGSSAVGQTPLFDYNFNVDSATQANSGTATSNTTLTLNNSSGVATNYDSANTGGMLGPSGSAGDYAFDLTSSTGMGSGSTGPGGLTAATSTNLANLTSLTVTGWFNASSVIGNGARLLDATAGTPTGFNLESTGTAGTLSLALNNTAYSSNTGAYAAVGSWVFFAATYDSVSGTIDFYTGTTSSGGVTEVGSDAASAGLITGQKLAIGNVYSGYARPFKGDLDNLEIFGSTTDSSGALSLSQLDAVYSTAVPEPSTTALLWIGGLFGVAIFFNRKRTGASSIA